MSQSKRKPHSNFQLDERDMHLLRLVAVARQNRGKEGKASMSGVIADLIERNRDALEAEARAAFSVAA